MCQSNCTQVELFGNNLGIHTVKVCAEMLEEINELCREFLAAIIADIARRMVNPLFWSGKEIVAIHRRLAVKTGSHKARIILFEYVRSMSNTPMEKSIEKTLRKYSNWCI